MREILFRAKRKDNGMLVYGFLAKMWGVLHIIDKDNENIAYEIIPETVGQYSELVDKNGKKIFEGDIVSYEDCPASDYSKDIVNRGVIEFSGGAFYVTKRETVEMSDLIYDETMECKIIGNCWDNPELLQEVE